MGDILCDLTCPDCGRKFNETLRRLSEIPTVTCPGCGEEIDVNLTDERGRQMTTKFGELQASQGVQGDRPTITPTITAPPARRLRAA